MEWSDIYAEFEKLARKEGFEEIATSFKEIAEVEEFHEEWYRKLAKNVASEEVFKKKTTVKWYCTNCGYIKEGLEAPK
jgi:rubrerythrin